MKILFLVVVLVACNKDDQAKAKEVGAKAEVQAEKAEKQAKKPIAIGGPVTAAVALQAMCDAADGKGINSEAVKAAAEKRPNADVLNMWGAAVKLAPPERAKMFRDALDKAGIKDCKLVDELAKPDEPAKPDAPAKP